MSLSAREPQGDVGPAGVAIDGIVTLLPSRAPIAEHQRVYDSEIRDEASSMIRSISGWRGVFGDSESSLSTGITPPKRYVGAAMALAFARFLRERERTGTIIVGCDGRPTGPVLADVMVRVFLSLELPVVFLGVSSSPETVAFASTESGVAGVCYITASHNPPGYNGAKWGDRDGSVLGADDARELSEIFEAIVTQREVGESLRRLVVHSPPPDVERTTAEQPANRKRAKEAYFSLVTARAGRGRRWEDLRPFFTETVVVADMNGSARSTGVDAEVLAGLGAELDSIDAVPGRISHVIEPEGPGLDRCRDRIRELLRNGAPVSLGYVPDNDGDRGNLVFPSKPSVRTLASQDVFCLAVLAELSWLAAGGSLSGNSVAIVANGPTSLRVEEIADVFGATPFRAEVGEANVVTKAQELRNEGWFVPILGEGSNGGNITFPGTIRDPLSTVVSMLRLFAMKPDAEIAPLSYALSALRTINAHTGDNGTRGRFSQGVDSSGRNRSPEGTDDRPRDGSSNGPNHAPADIPTPAELFDTLYSLLPVWHTTPVTAPEAKIEVGAIAHADLKSRMEHLLPSTVDAAIRLLEPVGAASHWEIRNFEGTTCRIGAGERDPEGDGTGGFAVWFYDENRKPFAFTWMRGSRTEPLFRVISDVRGIPRDPPKSEAVLESLHSWFRSMIRTALE